MKAKTVTSPNEPGNAEREVDLVVFRSRRVVRQRRWLTSAMATAATLDDWRRPKPEPQRQAAAKAPSPEIPAEIAKSEPSYGLFKAVSAMRGKTGYRLHTVPASLDSARAHI